MINYCEDCIEYKKRWIQFHGRCKSPKAYLIGEGLVNRDAVPYAYAERRDGNCGKLGVNFISRTDKKDVITATEMLARLSGDLYYEGKRYTLTIWKVGTNNVLGCTYISKDGIKLREPIFGDDLDEILYELFAWAINWIK